MPYRLLDVGDTAVTVEFGDGVDPDLLAAVATFDRSVQSAMAAGQLLGVIETVPTFRSLTLIYDPLQTRRAEIDPVLVNLLAQPVGENTLSGRRWQLPVCYGGDFGPDLESMAEATGFSPSELIGLHAAKPYSVYMLGFLPGFPFMGDLPEQLSLPRRPEPRLRVPAGSVATAGRLTAIYPWESPGGWHLLGRCPVPLFSPEWPGAALFLPGDRVGFQAVDRLEFERLERHWQQYRHLPDEYLVCEGAA